MKHRIYLFSSLVPFFTKYTIAKWHKFWTLLQKQVYIIYALGMCVDFVVHEFLLVMISHFLVDMLLILRHIRLPNTFQMNLCKVLCGSLGSPVCRL